MRKGDVQVGDEQLLSFVFPEARFAQWVVGDVHVPHPRIVPNGRRDDFEHSPALVQLHERLSDLGRQLAATIRERSDQRTRLKKVHLAVQYAEAWHAQSVGAASPALSAAAAERAGHFSQQALKAMDKLREGIAGREIAEQMTRRLVGELENWQRRNARRFSAVEPMQKAALLAVMSSSVKASEVMPLAVDVNRAMKRARR